MTEWRDVVGYEGRYVVSDDGAVRSLKTTGLGSGKTGKQLVPNTVQSGHHRVALYDGTGLVNRREFRVHRLMMQAFVGPCPEGMEVRHLNGNPADNRLANLRYGSRSENVQDAIRHGTNVNKNKVVCPLGHSLAEPNVVDYARKRGNRACLACARARAILRKYPHLDMKLTADEKYSQIVEGSHADK